MSACHTPRDCGPESRRGCFVCQPDEPDDEPLIGHTRHPADQDDIDTSQRLDERGFDE